MKMPKPDTEVIARRKQIVGALRDIVPGEGVIDEVNELRAYECDGLTAYRELPLIVVLPTTVEQVSKVFAYCHADGIKVVPRGAGTSLSGGALPLADAVTLGLGKFNRILDIDYDNRCVVAQTGVTNLAITEAVELHAVRGEQLLLLDPSRPLSIVAKQVRGPGGLGRVVVPVCPDQRDLTEDGHGGAEEVTVRAVGGEQLLLLDPLRCIGIEAEDVRSTGVGPVVVIKGRSDHGQVAAEGDSKAEAIAPGACGGEEFLVLNPIRGVGIEVEHIHRAGAGGAGVDML